MNKFFIVFFITLLLISCWKTKVDDLSEEKKEEIREYIMESSVNMENEYLECIKSKTIYKLENKFPSVDFENFELR